MPAQKASTAAQTVSENDADGVNRYSMAGQKIGELERGVKKNTNGLCKARDSPHAAHD